MSITFFNQWRQWIETGSWNWSEFDLITIAWERDKIAGDWGFDVALFGLGFHFHYVTRKALEHCQELVDDVKNDKEGGQ